MKATTLNDLVKENSKDEKFMQYYERDMIRNRIVELVVKLRKKTGMTQKQLAKRAHTTQPAIARLENGTEKHIPSLDFLTRIAHAANVH